MMPAYNVGRFLDDSVGSLQRQTVADWKLIIVNDGSTDDTLGKAERLAAADPRIMVISMPKGSGSAYQPRKRGILEAASEWVAPLDADDRVEPEYLAKLIARQRETDADIVYPTMYLPAYKGAEERVVTPTDAAIREGVHKGRDCVKFTLNGWRINCNGGLIRKKVYEKTFAENDSSLTYSCADELLTRQIFVQNPRVAVSEAKYYYGPNEESITRKKSRVLFNILINNRELIRLTRKEFGRESEEYLQAQKGAFHSYFDVLKLQNRYEFSKEDLAFCEGLLKEMRSEIEMELLEGNVSRKYAFLYKRPAWMAKSAMRLFKK